MTGRERCDEILRLIDQALAEVEMTDRALPKVPAGAETRLAGERLVGAFTP